jgi:NTE family protein
MVPHRRAVIIAAILVALLGCGALASADQPAAATRPRIGVAFGGGSARGLAHVGILRWFEEHHVPIDLVAGTSMCGLIGGAFAAGLSSSEIAQLLEETDWDEMFGSTPFRYKNVRRKRDARAYPSRIEFGLKHGIVPPLALNNGQQVNFLLSRIVGPYLPLASFDDLPTPFRCLAVDLVSAQSVVLDRGSLADALRATMSLPGVFPPMEIDGRVLVDGGAMNNVPANVVRGMGAEQVIAINVGFMGDTRTVNYSLMGLMGQTVDVMMQANTRVAMRGADIVINPVLEGYGSLDWRRSEALADEGYRAAEAVKDSLLPLAIGEAEWTAYVAWRRARRQSQLPTPAFLSVVGATSSDQQRMELVLLPHVGQPIDIAALETRLESFAGLDRYETVDWQLVDRGGQVGLEVRARPKTYAPPFLMLGVGLENTTTSQFAFQLAGRYLTFDVAGSGSELRIDASLGAEPSLGAELYRPIGATPFFVTGLALAIKQDLNFVSDDTVVAEYNQTRALIGAGGGVTVGRDDEVRVLMTIGTLTAGVSVGDPGLPELDGGETRSALRWTHDGQDSAIVPSRGVYALGELRHIFTSPEVPPGFTTDRTNSGVTQLEAGGSSFWPIRRRDRLFVTGGLGTSFDGRPLPTEQFQLGRPLRLGAEEIGSLRGDHYAVLTAGYLKGVGRLPDFLGGPVFVGGWIENGSAFDQLDAADVRTNISAGSVIDTLIGPAIVGASFGLSGNWRYYFGVGRVF